VGGTVSSAKVYFDGDCPAEIDVEGGMLAGTEASALDPVLPVRNLTFARFAA
jgi:hypothetical protein